MDNNNSNNGSEKKSFLRLPDIYRIDYSKPVPFRQQFAFMATVLVISCLLFSAVYIFQTLRSGSAQVAGAEASSASEQKDKNKSQPEKKKENEKESSKTSKKEASGSSGTKLLTKVSSSSKDVLGETRTVSVTDSDMGFGALVLVNKDYSSRYDGENIKLIFEEKSDSYVLSDNTVGVSQDIITNINTMLDDFQSLFGDSDIMIACGYRSYDTQVALYNNEMDESDKWVAPPGYSEHQTGYAFDLDLDLADGGKAGINYEGDGDYAWINENCGKYGFIIRYPKGKEDITGYEFEPWHFRYLGLPHSEYVADKGITLEEYIDFLHSHGPDNALVMDDESGSSWCVYYVAADEEADSTEVIVPVNYSYEISGDNVSGFVVTVKLS